MPKSNPTSDRRQPSKPKFYCRPILALPGEWFQLFLAGKITKEEFQLPIVVDSLCEYREYVDDRGRQDFRPAGCEASNTHLAELLGVDPATMPDLIRRVSRRGYLVRKSGALWPTWNLPRGA